MAIFNESYTNQLLNEANRYSDAPFHIPFLNKKFYTDLALLRYCTPRWSEEKILKSHEYPGLLNMIDHCKTKDDIDYIRAELSVASFGKIADRIDKCNKLGKCDETKNYYNGIYNNYIKKGITSTDVKLYSKWLSTVVRKKLSEKAKEIKNQ